MNSKTGEDGRTSMDRLGVYAGRGIAGSIQHHDDPYEAGRRAAARCNVSVYTTHDQGEQPAIVHHVTALTVVAGLLTIECDVTENGHTFSAHHRFEPGKWTHFSTVVFGSYRQEDG